MFKHLLQISSNSTQKAGFQLTRNSKSSQACLSSFVLSNSQTIYPIKSLCGPDDIDLNIRYRLAPF